MNALSRNALKAYEVTETGSMTDNASPHQLILLLYDGAIKAVAKAKFALGNNEVATKCQAITHAYCIIQEGLQLSLDVKAGGDMAENLNALYDYMLDRLLIANAKNDMEALDEVAKLLNDLRSAWAAIGNKPSKPNMQVVYETSTPERAVSLSYGAA